MVLGAVGCGVVDVAAAVIDGAGTVCVVISAAVVDSVKGCNVVARLAEATGVIGSRVRVATDVVAPAPLDPISGTVT
ncbi:MAG: hypothetical protein M3Y35_08610 [Actinomycetota bacterium]|nr:hypothetical protein [Actinomycetota bacterium]